MIDPQLETLISLADATKVLPARRGGKRPHISCIYRWTVAGCKGIKLESLQVGGTRCTSREALGRFFERLSLSAGPETNRPTIRTPNRRAREVAQAERELNAAGY
jgi:uncharacterized protein DUF1580